MTSSSRSAAVTVVAVTAASPAADLWRNTSRGLKVSPAARARATSCMATMLSPPSEKKSSSTPTRSRPSTSATSPQRVSSSGVRGRVSVTSAAKSGAGRARRSSLPLGVSGRTSRVTTAAGTMWSGSDWAAWARSWAESTGPPATTYATSRSSRRTTVACVTLSCAANTLSVSPSSMRKPRSLTWSSARPRYSSSPSRVQRARSPVRYMRAPGSTAYGSATKRSAVRAGRPR